MQKKRKMRILPDMNTQSKHVTDMTTGSPVKHLLHFAWPLLVGNVFQQLYNMVDSIIVGQFVGADALASVGTCGSTNFLFFSLSSGLSIGSGIIVSQYFGAKDEARVKATIANSVYVIGSVTALLGVAAFLLSPFILRLLQTPDDIIANAVIYMRTTSCGIIAIGSYNAISSILRALGDSKTPLYFLIVSSIVNVALDLFFVINLRLGVFGVALATIIAQAVSAVSCFCYAYRNVSFFRIKKEEMKPNVQIIKQTFTLGTPLALQYSIIAVSCMALQGMVNSFCKTVMSAFTITGRIEQIVQQGYNSLSSALTTYSGQNMGAKKVDRVKLGFKRGSQLALVFSLCLIPIAYLFGKPIVSLFVDDAEVINFAYKALRITSLTYFGLGMIYVPRAVLNGCGDAGFAMINGVTEVVCRIGYSQILTRIPLFGVWGIWATNAFTWTTTAVVCVIRYCRGKWMTISVVDGKSSGNK